MRVKKVQICNIIQKYDINIQNFISDRVNNEKERHNNTKEQHNIWTMLEFFALLSRFCYQWSKNHKGCQRDQVTRSLVPLKQGHRFKSCDDDDDDVWSALLS